jgi:hypothetical protein
MPIIAGGVTVQALPIEHETGVLLRIESPSEVGPSPERLAHRAIRAWAKPGIRGK